MPATESGDGLRSNDPIAQFQATFINGPQKHPKKESATQAKHVNYTICLRDPSGASPELLNVMTVFAERPSGQGYELTIAAEDLAILDFFNSN